MTKVYCFDLDNTICKTNGTDYANAEPIDSMIEKINKLYSDNKIIINTARGSISKVDYYDLTNKQLKEWGVLYHELYVGSKIHADYYIDDKNLSIEDFKRLNND
jgi:hypothetical protein